eukprot:170224_1
MLNNLYNDDEHKANKPNKSEEEASLLAKAPAINIPNRMEKFKNKQNNQQKRNKTPINYWSLVTNVNFLFFAATVGISIGLFIWHLLGVTPQITYAVSGIIGLIIPIIGYRHFNTLIALTNVADNFSKNNKKLKTEHTEIKNYVETLMGANCNLKDTETRLRNANERNKQNLNSFHDIQTFMKQNDNNTIRIEDFESIAKRAGNIGSQWRQQLLQNEKRMLHLLFDRYEMENDNQEGMTRQEFETFSSSLPDEYRKRFVRLGTFSKLCNDKKVLEYADFKVVVDSFVEMVVDNVDIEFEIVKEKI